MQSGVSARTAEDTAKSQEAMESAEAALERVDVSTENLRNYLCILCGSSRISTDFQTTVEFQLLTSCVVPLRSCSLHLVVDWIQTELGKCVFARASRCVTCR